MTIDDESSNPFTREYIDRQHLDDFANAINPEHNTEYEYITSMADWAPVNRKLKHKGSHKKGSSLPRKDSGVCDTGIGLGYTILRWPALVLILLWVLLLAAIYAIVRIYVALHEYFLTWRGERRQLREYLRHSTSYNEWVANAKTLDDYLGFSSWRDEPKFSMYDYRTVDRIVKNLRGLIADKKVEDIATILQGCVKHNFAGTQDTPLYSNTYYGTKNLVHEFNDEIVKSLDLLSETDQLSKQSKRILFKSFSKNFGKSALCLSGGATFTYRHFGVVKALLENDLLPNIVSGTSGGGLVAALVCTRTNAELKQLLVPELADKLTACWEGFPNWAIRMYRTGARFDSLDWAERCSWFTLGSLTFKEAYQRTGKILNISTVPADSNSPVILCNYITSPDCVIWSALLASAAVPGILNPVVLMMKTKDNRLVPYSFGNKWKDGSLRTDIPVQALNMYFNVNFTVVSQVNPHISLFVYAPRGTVGRPVSHRKGKGWRGGFVGSALEDMVKLEIRKWLKLMRNLKLIPRLMDQDWSSIWLQRFDGTVTLWPKIRLADFWNILSDPSQEKLSEMMKNGELCTYPKLLFIQHQVNIERAIERGRRFNSSNRRRDIINEKPKSKKSRNQLTVPDDDDDADIIPEVYHSSSSTDQRTFWGKTNSKKMEEYYSDYDDSDDSL